MGAIDKTIKLIIKAALLLGLVVGLVYFVACVYGNIKAMDRNPRDVPGVEEALYSVVIKNTGNTLFSNDAERQGSIVTLEGFWELGKGKYKYNEGTIPLDEDIFGPITVRRR